MRQLFFTLLLFVTILTSCEKWDLARESFPEVITGDAVMEENVLKVTLHGEIKGLIESERAENHGYLWTNQENAPLELPHFTRTSLGTSGNRTFDSELNNLQTGQTYYYRAYAQIGNEVLYGEIKSFNTSSLMVTTRIDSIVIHERTNVLINRVKIYLTYDNLPVGLEIQDGGIVMSKQPNPNIEDHFSEGIGFFTSSNPTLSFTLTSHIGINEDHYFRPYLAVDGQVHYGEKVLFNVVDFWRQKADFGGDGRFRAVGFSIGNKGYIGTGRNENGDFKKDFWEYDPITDEWTQKADFLGDPRWGAVGFSIWNKGYVGTGWVINSSNETKDFWEYDPDSDNWTPKADFGGGERAHAVGFSIGNKGYVGTGLDSNNIRKKDFWEYDPISDNWVQKADFGGGEKNDAVGFSIGNKGYVGTGLDSNSNPTKDLWEYNPDTDNWTPKADIEVGNDYGRVGFSIGNKGYITGALSDFWEYDKDTDKWTQKADLGIGHIFKGVGFSIGNKGYLGTGQLIYPERIKKLWEYIPE